MKIKSTLKPAFKKVFLEPLLNRMDAWEAEVINTPGAMRGGEASAVRFNILREGLKMDGDHPPMPGFPRSFPQVLGSVTNIRKSVRDLDRNPLEGKKQIDADALEELRQFASKVGADEIGYSYPLRIDHRIPGSFQ